MHKYLILFSFVLLLGLPFFAAAAADELTFSEDTNITVGDYTLVVVANSSSTSMTIGSTYVDIVLSPTSIFTLRSNERRYMTNNFPFTTSCSSNSYSSITLTSTTTQTVRVIPTTTICAPNGLAAVDNGSAQINLTWDAAAGASTYNIYRSATSGGTFSLIGSSASASYSDTGLTWSTTYYYKVKTVFANADLSLYSSEAYDTTAPYLGGGGGGGGDISAPSVSGIVATVGDTTATITWTTNEASLSWLVYGLTTAYGSEQKTTTYATSHSLNLTGLSAGTTYHYQVKSKDSTGNIGSYTDKTFVTTGTPTTTTPITPTVTIATTGALAPASATNKTGYTLMKATGSNDVYVIQNGLKLPVRSIDVFTSSGYGSATVKTVSAVSLKAVEAAALIKTDENPDVYRLENNFRRKLASIEIFNTYKLNWNKISIISQSVMDSFSYAPIYKHGVDLYWRDASNILHKFPTMAIFTAKGYNIRDLIPINDLEFTSFSIGAALTN
ncbi:MAG: hypothetical protein HY813_03550 [Candidatus Portnoybacteria bacterium]|nr:hypothetical protein [Candidatus Portnoybacteria bacterium]